MAGLRDFLSSVGTQNTEFGLHPEDEPLHSSINEVKNLTETTVWDDIETLVDERIEVLQEVLVEEDDPVEIRRLQGTIRAWRNFKEMPELLIRYLDMQQDPSQNGQHS